MRRCQPLCVHYGPEFLSTRTFEIIREEQFITTVTSIVAEIKGGPHKSSVKFATMTRHLSLDDKRITLPFWQFALELRLLICYNDGHE